MNIIRDTQVVVIGAGVIGCSIAYHLAIRGVDVTVVDAGAIGEGTSTATLGLVWVQGKEPGPYMELNMLGALLHARLAINFNEDVGLRQPGGLILCADVGKFEESKNTWKRLRETTTNYQAQILTPAEVCELEPHVSPTIAGGIYSPYDGHVNPIKLLINLVRLAKRHGVQFILNTPILRITRNEEGVTGVDTLDGSLCAKKVVVAAGTGTPALVQPLGLHLPLKYDRGQILVTAPIKLILNYPTDNIRQTVEGNILIGTTHEQAGLDKSTTISAATKIAHNAIKVFPFLKDIPIIRQFAGIRPMPIDGKPYLGPVEKVPGLYIAVSHSGITLMPVHGKVISELILNGNTDVPIENYRPDRFAEN